MSKPVIEPSEIRAGDRIRITREVEVASTLYTYDARQGRYVHQVRTNDIAGGEINLLDGVEVKLLERPKRLPKDVDLISATSEHGYTTYFQRAGDGVSWHEDGGTIEETEEYVIEEIENISQGLYVAWKHEKVGQL